MISSFKPFHLMTPEDYEAIGLKCGLEIHQQLLTRGKLFCRCPAGRYSNDYDAVILRHMRPTLSELGEYDGTALMEKKTKKNIFYRIHQNTVCTYEMDDTPPFFIDEEALDIALEVALLLRLNMVDELHIARKQYLDGSIPTGFQRTTIVGVDGWIPYKDRRIGIAQLGLEEDSCREVSDKGHDRVYLTDRLGMPLIETVTDPDMRTPEETADVAEIVRRLTRSTGEVRTGLGAARQDVNVSVRGGTRVEIKGVSRIDRIPRLVYNEAMRQCSLLRIRGLLAERGVTSDSFSWSSRDVTSVISRTSYAPILAALEQGYHVHCVRLEKFAGLLGKTTQTDTVFAKELSDRVRVIACLTTLPNIVHSDTASELLTGAEWQKLRKSMRADQSDALVLVWGDEQDTRCACQEIANRAREATEGVPSDTRQALSDETSGFERVLPGADRMYPDTDLPPLAVNEDRLGKIRQQLPEYVWDRSARYRRMGIPDASIEPLSLSPRAGVFDRIAADSPGAARCAAVVLSQQLKAFTRQGLDPTHLTDDEIHDVFRAWIEHRLAREGIVEVLRHVLRQGPPVDSLHSGSRVADALLGLGYDQADESELEKAVSDSLEQASERRFESSQTKHRYLMGRLMQSLLGRVEGRRLAAMVEDRIRRAEGALHP